MKYNSKEICYFGLNAGKSRWEKTERLGQIAYRRYNKNLQRILPKMPKRYQSFFKDIGKLGDGDVSKITYSVSPQKDFIEIGVTNCNNGKLYILKFATIRKCNLNYPSDEPIYYDKTSPTLGFWFASELGMTRDGWFIYEIIFSSGATLFIEFKKFSYKTK